jgi:hypothetical protein
MAVPGDLHRLWLPKGVAGIASRASLPSQREMKQHLWQDRTQGAVQLESRARFVTRLEP